MAGKVLIIRWADSAYDSLGGLLELVADELTNQGLDVELFEAAGKDWPNRLLAVLRQGGFSFALTMSGIAVDLMIEGKLLWEAAKVPLFNWCCDHPCYFPSRHVLRSPFLLHGYVFPDHARYGIDHFHPNGAAYAVHLAMPPRYFFNEAPLPLAGRNGRIAFTKSGRETNAIEAEWKERGEVIRGILFDGAEALLHRATGDFLPVLRGIAEPRGLFLDGNSKLAMYLIGQLDPYVRFRRSDIAMRALLDYPVDVFGAGWDHLPAREGAARFHGPIPWRENMRRLPGYLGCLSLNPLIDESVHDRVFFALAAGVVPLSDDNGFAGDLMPGLAPYRFECEPDQVRGAVDALLADPKGALDRTEDAWKALSPEYTLRRSVLRILEFVSVNRLNAPL